MSIYNVKGLFRKARRTYQNRGRGRRGGGEDDTRMRKEQERGIELRGKCDRDNCAAALPSLMLLLCSMGLRRRCPVPRDSL